MHILTSTSASLDDLAEPVDLRQSPGDIVALSFSDSDLSGIATAHAGFGAPLPSMRLAALRDLRHPMSVDLWLDSVAAHAKLILVRILGGYEWWRYGCDQLAALARQQGIALAMLPGECRDSDARLIECSTLPVETLDGLLDYFREGGPANMTALVARLATLAGAEAPAAAPVEVPKAGFYDWAGRVEAGSAAGQRPPLACRPSPPQGGRLVSSPASVISPLVGEMAGRPEGGAKDPQGSNCLSDPTPIVPVLFYRSMLLASDVAPIDALCSALAEKGIRPVPIFVASLKEPTSVAFVEQALVDLAPAAIVTCTAFASGAEAGGQTMFDRAGVPVFQAVVATTRREAWQSGPRGLAPSDLAMHVVMPELDGRLLAGVVSFKARQTADAETGFGTTINLPEPDRIDQVAARIATYLHLAATPRADRRIAILMPDYPGAPGRTGYAVGLDVPSSVIAMLQDLKDAGYHVEAIPESPRDLLRVLDRGDHGLSRADYVELASEVPAEAMEKVEAAWGATSSLISPLVGEMSAQPTEGGAVPPRFQAVAVAESDQRSHSTLPPSALPGISPTGGEISHAIASPALSSSPVHPTPPRFPFRAASFGNVTVMLAPDRGRSADRRADYHDASLPPHHALLAFGLWLRHRLGVHALVHLGAHGTLEWLPGKTVALSRACFPEIVTGGLPVVYPFIVSNPGEAAQAKRRIAAVTIGHLPPPLSHAGLDENQQKLERLVDEYAQADGLDRRRRDRLAKLIVETASTTGLATEAGVTGLDAPDEALRRIDAWLCDLKDLAVKDGLHIFGRSAEDETDPARLTSASAERSALLASLDGRHIPAGPAGAPARGRADVLPTGRNLFTADPRSMPTPTAFDLGKAAAEDVLRRYLQDHGDWPRALVIDLWGSASLRTGGEEIAQGLFLMGCRPQWEPSTGRVTGVEVLPQATIGRPRIDVTWRISGLFRDMFPTQIALLDAAAAAVAACDEDAGDNPLRAATIAEGTAPARIFGSSPGVYGAGIEDLLSSGDWESRDEIGRAYLAAASHAYGGAEGEARVAPGAFEKRIAAADLLVHTGDDPGRDILEGSADVAFVGGFTAAIALLGRNADVIVLDTTDPARPRPRSITEAVTRVVRARAANPRFIAGQMRHGPRGASEFAETVDRLVGFAETTGAVPGTLIDAVHEAYLGDEAVRAFILRENPAAAIAIAERLASARRRGLWHPLRNSIDDDLAALIAEARVLEQAA